MQDTGRVVVYITAPNEEEAERIARMLVDKRLAACVALVSPIRSIYRWKEEVCDEKEVLLIAKTTAAMFGALRDAVLEAHSYEVPEIVAVPIADGEPRYLQWITDNADGERA
ncbi:MAG: Divalent-cation tolerance protein CutA [bacterium ADurb.Bin236]|nr:MAG: Divalent-cation tolerance protein CutA [bacterium ADurb.Bin236]HOY63049.1 divalent-cation tolerance protein CutA [bacterium]HPN94912.1 divalent-cation tolerance protein CutA [bacterium]